MAKNNFLLVDLQDTKTQKLAETITSTTSRKILNHLAEKNDTKNEMAKKLKIPLPTISYHLDKLEKAGLVISKEFHYSKKGRVVDHYALANKYIIIAPKKVSGLKQKLKGILPVAIICLGISAVIQWFPSLLNSKPTIPFHESTPASNNIARSIVEESVTESVLAVPQIVEPTIIQSTNSSIALWFLLGSMSAIIIYMFILLIKEYIAQQKEK